MTRFKNIPVYIQRPLDEEISAPALDIQLPKKTIMELDHVNPFNEKVDNLNNKTYTFASVLIII
jgi:hypothetical protein